MSRPSFSAPTIASSLVLAALLSVQPAAAHLGHEHSQAEAQQQQQLQPAAQQPVADAFRQVLERFGTFQTHARYGEVWVPSPAVAPQGWRPYPQCHWVYQREERTWYFNDQTEWGNIVHHYGRWANDPSLGWIWVADTAHGPGWVHWHFDSQTVSWAAMLPPQDEGQQPPAEAWHSQDVNTFNASCQQQQQQPVATAPRVPAAVQPQAPGIAALPPVVITPRPPVVIAQPPIDELPPEPQPPVVVAPPPPLPPPVVIVRPPLPQPPPVVIVRPPLPQPPPVVIVRPPLPQPPPVVIVRPPLPPQPPVLIAQPPNGPGVRPPGVIPPIAGVGPPGVRPPNGPGVRPPGPIAGVNPCGPGRHHSVNCGPLGPVRPPVIVRPPIQVAGVRPPILGGGIRPPHNPGVVRPPIVRPPHVVGGVRPPIVRPPHVVGGVRPPIVRPPHVAGGVRPPFVRGPIVRPPHGVRPPMIRSPQIVRGPVFRQPIRAPIARVAPRMPHVMPRVVRPTFSAPRIARPTFSAPRRHFARR